MLISASEDIGLANPNALLLAQGCFNAISVIGMPEARIILSETAIYLSISPKSNSAYLAIDAALNAVRETGMLHVPLHLRNAPSKLMKDLNYGDGYKYSHDYPGHFAEQEFLPKEFSNNSFWKPSENKREQDTKQYMQSLWKDKYSF